MARFSQGKTKFHHFCTVCLKVVTMATRSAFRNIIVWLPIPENIQNHALTVMIYGGIALRLQGTTPQLPSF